MLYENVEKEMENLIMIRKKELQLGSIKYDRGIEIRIEKLEWRSEELEIETKNRNLGSWNLGIRIKKQQFMYRKNTIRIEKLE